MLVKDVFGLKHNSGMFGVEIEVEGQNLPTYIDYSWRVEHDGSLRGESCEYVLTSPLSKLKTFKAIEALNKALENSKLHFSHRTSVHVHCNVSNLTRNQLINFIFISYLFDKVMARYGGREIVGNRFCLPISDAQFGINYLERLVTETKGIYIPGLQEAKYQAVNIHPVSRYGSVEFRAMRGTVDVDVLKNWIGMIEKLYNYSFKHTTIVEMLEGFIEDELAFTKKVFGTKLAALLSNEHLSADLRLNYSLLIHIPYAVKYNKEDVAVVKKEEKKAKELVADLAAKYEELLRQPIVLGADVFIDP